jgi:protein SCO1/2
MRAVQALLALALTALCVLPGAVALADPLQKARLDQRLGAQVPLEARFFDETGRVVILADYVGRRPVVITFAYFSCSQLCSDVLGSEAASLKALPPGTDYEALTISIDPEDGPRSAAMRRQMLGATGMPWHFLTGAKGAIRAVTDACGFRYAYDRPTHQFAHPAGLMVLTPHGKLSRYFYGLSYPTAELAGAIRAAGREAVSEPVPEQLLRCFHDVFTSGRYGPLVDLALKIGCSLTVVGLAAFVGWQLRGERRAGMGG